MNFLCLGIVVSALGAGGQVASDARSEPAKPNEVAAFFHDGTIVRHIVLHGDVQITTKYGKLTVPVSDIRRVEVGFRLPEDVAQRIDAAVKQLGSEQFPAREGAEKELVAIGFRACPALQAAAQSSDKEVAKRATAALAAIREDLSEQEMRFKEDDVIYTRDCVLAGRVDGPSLKGQTATLGELPLKLADLRMICSTAVTKASIRVDVAQLGNFPQTWFDTGFEVDAGTGLVLTGAGQIDLVPGQPGQHMSGPEGSPNAGQNGRYLCGTLLGRIGERGDLFLIGRQFQGRTTQAGKLYVQVVPAPGNNKPMGEFLINATAGFEIAPAAKTNAAGIGISGVAFPPPGVPSAVGSGFRGRGPRGGPP
jgi:hypothetical protein